MAQIIFNVLAVVNNKPTITNVNINTWNRNVYSFTLANFTTDANFNDPEGDSLEKVKVVSLPTQGTLVYGNSNIAVTISQEFTSSEINSGVLKFICPNINNSATSPFNFSVSDTGSSTFSDVKSCVVTSDVLSNYGFAITTSADLTTSQVESIKTNWNSRDNSSYWNFNLGVLQNAALYPDSPIYTGLSADSIVIESFQDDIILTNSFSPWSPLATWSPNPSGYVQKQLLDSSNTPITLPYTISVTGNTATSDIGVKVNFASGELLVPTTVGSPYSAYSFSFRRLIVGYKIYSGGIAQTPTLYFLWYRGLTT